LKRLGGARRGAGYAPEDVLPVFLQVLTDCLVVR
jgi:hypothetical protein